MQGTGQQNVRGATDWQALVAQPSPGQHIAQVYQDPDFLADTVSSFVSEGLARGDSVILIVTPAHCDLFMRKLRLAGLDVSAALQSRQIEVLDAAATLSVFFTEGRLERDAFRRCLGGVIGDARARHGRVRAFGEMVDILWRQGKRDTAEQIEGLWNDLARDHEFVLLCAYYMDNLSRDAYGGALQCVCRAHTHLIPAPDYAVFESAVNRASEEVLGKPLADVMRQLVERAGRTTEMPIAQATLLWLNEHMPATGEKIIGGVRRLAAG